MKVRMVTSENVRFPSVSSSPYVCSPATRHRVSFRRDFSEMVRVQPVKPIPRQSLSLSNAVQLSNCLGMVLQLCQAAKQSGRFFGTKVCTQCNKICARRFLAPPVKQHKAAQAPVKQHKVVVLGLEANVLLPTWIFWINKGHNMVSGI